MLDKVSGLFPSQGNDSEEVFSWEYKRKYRNIRTMNGGLRVRTEKVLICLS